MISWLKGRVLEKMEAGVVLDVQGVGYEVFVSLNTLFALPVEGETVALRIQTVVREDAIALYGFTTVTERRLFNTLVKVSGIGPKVAMGILSHVSPEELVTMVVSKETKKLMKLPGIGRKTAERILLEIADELQSMDISMRGNSGMSSTNYTGQTTARNEAIEALISLGFNRSQVEKCLRDGECVNKTADELIRLGLKELSPHSN